MNPGSWDETTTWRVFQCHTKVINSMQLAVRYEIQEEKKERKSETVHSLSQM